MAIYNGAVITGGLGIIAEDNPQIISSNFEGSNYAFSLETARTETLIGTSSHAILNPPGRNFSGIKTASFETDFFEKIYLSPLETNIGIVAFTQEFPLYVFNAYWYSAQQCTALNSVSASDAVLSVGPIATPFTLQPGEQVDYIVTVPLAGAIEFAASHQWVFPGANSVISRFTGNRLAIPYMLDAEWSDGVSVTKRYLTSIFAGKNQHENRLVLRANPIREVEAKLFYHSRAGALKAWASLNSTTSRRFGTAFVPDASEVTGDIINDVIPCNTNYRRFGVEKYLLIVRFDSTGELADQQVLKITDVNPGSITVSSTPNAGFGEGSIVFPMIICIPSLSAGNIEQITDSVGIIFFRAIEEYGENMTEIENINYSPTLALDGNPIYPFDVNWATSPSIGTVVSGEIVESGIGAYFDIYSAPFHTYKVVSSLFSREQSWEAAGFFNFIAGRGRAFWLKGTMRMFRVIAAFGGGGGALTIRIEKDIQIDELQLLRAVYVKGSDGTESCCKVVDILEEPLYFTLTTSDSPNTDVVEMREAILGRLSMDEVTEKYITDSLSEIEITIQELVGAYE